MPNKSKANVVRASVETTRVYRRLSNNLTDHLCRQRIGYSDDDIYAVIMYCSGPQLAMHYDALGSWAKMIIESLPMNTAGTHRIIPEPR